ncbi:hypothetical protein V5F40_12230 [Xanthobacter sp. DSM 14520]
MVLFMDTFSPALHERISSSDRRRQLENSIAQAMDRYNSDFEAIRANTARLRALREAREAEAEALVVVAPVRKRRTKAQAKAI